MKEYTVYFKVLAEFGTKVFADSTEEAEKLARKDYDEASIGDFEWLDELSVDIDSEN